MLIIKRLRIEIHTDGGLYGFDDSFNMGLNFIASDNNTCGKSSILGAIYYCLGCEEILGGQGVKTLTSVFKNELEDEKNNTHVILQSCAFLEISNGKDIITIFRSMVNEKREEKLVSVYFSELSQIHNIKTTRKDYYVLSRNSATNDSGFHSFLNKFLNLSLPIVYDSVDNQHKLYIQQIFAALFIEQKKGWAELLSRVPYLGVSDVKKHVIEYLVNLSKNEDDHKKRLLTQKMCEIETNWAYLIKDIDERLSNDSCNIFGIPNKPEILTREQITEASIIYNSQCNINDYVKKLEEELNSIVKSSPKVIDNFEELSKQLIEIEAEIIGLKEICHEFVVQKGLEEKSIKMQEHSLEQIQTDIVNNKDAQKLKSLGAELSCEFAKEICPLCGQTIKDTLLPDDGLVMSIQENIAHLESQKKMLIYSINAHKNKLNSIEKNLINNNNLVLELERIAQSLRSDIFSVDGTYSETVVLKKVKLFEKIERLKFQQEYFEEKKEVILSLSNEWAKTLNEKKCLIKGNLSSQDIDKINYLKNKFVEFLFVFNYSSINNRNKIKISDDTYLPLIEEFDMKFDSSASDGVRMIWAYTLALLKTSYKYGINGLNILMFDEPKQHSIVNNDLKKFFEIIINICRECKSQIIVGITAKEGDTKEVIDSFDVDSYSMISLHGKAFKQMK